MNDQKVPLKTPYENWTLAPRRAGKDMVLSEDKTTYLCNQLYLIHTTGVNAYSLGKTIKICCCECSSSESTLVSTWYQYASQKCYNCERTIREIYNPYKKYI